jgi:hypothetical protein
MASPDPDTLRRWVGTVLEAPGVPVAVRNECHQFFLAVEMYDFAMARESLRRIQRLADEAGMSIPPCEIAED